SVQMGERLSLLQSLEAAARDNGEIRGEVVAKVKSGFAVDVGVRAFLPASQATLRPGGFVPDLVGQTLNFQIDTLQLKRMNVVLTRRSILETERAAAAEETLKRLHEGEVVEGQVVSFTNYGMFVDVGGIDGLVHSSDVRWGRSVDPKSVFELGATIKVKVLEVNRAESKVQLGTKQLTDDPWLRVADELPVGRRLSGRVVSLTKYGAFLEVLPGVEGMVHVSEMSWTERVSDPKKIVKAGESHEVVVLDVDQENRRLSLGLKQALPNPWEQWAAKYAIGTEVSGPVSSVTEFGVFINLEPGLDGLVHVSDIRWGERVDKPSELFKKGDDVKAVVLKLDGESQRLSLGIKQLSEDPWKAVASRYKRGTVIKGKVTRLADFGAFVQLEPESVEGLIHISQLSVDRVEKPADVVAVGQDVEAMVVNVDRRQRKVSLSMRAVHEGLDDDYKDYMQDDAADFGNPLAAALQKATAKDE
ncbi:MAG: S1 RNA-binding domain-containing protein, partial [Myxococcota bacterium]